MSLKACAISMDEEISVLQACEAITDQFDCEISVEPIIILEAEMSLKPCAISMDEEISVQACEAITDQFDCEISVEACEDIRDQFDHGHDQHIEIVERVTASINQKLLNLTPIHPERCIFRVPEVLRCGNEEFYEPQVIAIGPYHRGKPGLASMEEHKIRYLQNILQRTKGNQSVDCLVGAVVPHVERVRKCYAECIGHLLSNELVQMLVLDGCFIIELFYRIEMITISMLTRDPKIKIIDDDPVMNSTILKIALAKDMLLVENQIPFFILEILFNTIHPHLSIRNQLKRQTLVFFRARLTRYSWTSFEFLQLLNKDLFSLDESFMNGCMTKDIEQLISQNVFHLLDIIHKAICFRFKETWRWRQTSPPSQTKIHFVMDIIHKAICFRFRETSSHTDPPSQTKIHFVNSVTKLKEANVRLNASSSFERSIFDITFKDGVLKIPCLSIDDASEIQIRNFIVLELCQQNQEMMRFFCDYTLFMDHLIASSDDVDLLTHCGIFDNIVIDANSVNNMFRKLTRNVVSSNPYTYSTISIEMNKYCDRTWNKWSASLKQNYFNTPWAIISVIAALVLLGLTITQTVFSIIS